MNQIVPDKPTINRFGKIIKADHTGDSTVATFTPGVENEASEVAQADLTAFLEDCITKHGRTPPVFGKRLGAGKYTPFIPDNDSIVDVETVLIMEPLIGG
jgi:hypothetical protein